MDLGILCEDILYKGWVIFIDGHTEDIIEAHKYGENRVEVVTESGKRYMYKRVLDDFEMHPQRPLKLPTHEFSEFIHDEWYLTNEIRSFEFDPTKPLSNNKMNIIEFIESTGLELCEFQKQFLRNYAKIPKDVTLVMGRNDQYHWVPKTRKD